MGIKYFILRRFLPHPNLRSVFYAIFGVLGHVLVRTDRCRGACISRGHYNSCHCNSDLRD